MKINTQDVRQCLKAFDFKTLFYEHLGWDKHQARLAVPVDNSTVTLTAIAQKRGFVAFVCDSIPSRQARLKIDRQVTKSAREHFVIYADEPAGQQVWHWVRRETGKPLASRDHRFDVFQSGDPLIQRLERIAVSMEEEEKLTLPDMTGRGREAFDVDKVTKKFYERFKAEHAA
ncbi:MAG: SAM-dependent methyltransferase, partial [Kiritimatiellae bacterium]|nr:SAM-dependent methyltransferase [Kiritimatiellia bacterium]